jgi:hypothetical protein
MPQINCGEAKEILLNLYKRTNAGIDENVKQLLIGYSKQLNIIFESRTQSYREALLGCALIHLINTDINIRLPYIKHGDGSFNGRTLDEQVVNPFLQEQLIPCSKGPYLATFRRNVKLIPETAVGLRDKAGYSAMLELLCEIENCLTDKSTEDFIMCLLNRFIMLRDASRIPLAHINRLSIKQYSELLKMLLMQQSGGLIPVLVTVAFFQMLNEYYSLAWDIYWQGINVADNATGSEGDVTIKKAGETILAIEITERPIDHRRIVSTFNTKIIHNDVKEYLFIYTNAEPDDTARQATKNLFSQGYDINFANIIELITNNFYVLSSRAREIFTNKILSLLDNIDVPALVKMTWNECIKNILEI